MQSDHLFVMLFGSFLKQCLQASPLSCWGRLVLAGGFLFPVVGVKRPAKIFIKGESVKKHPCECQDEGYHGRTVCVLSECSMENYKYTLVDWKQRGCCNNCCP